MASPSTTKHAPSGAAMLQWQYKKLIGQLILLQDHAADPSCPCVLGTDGEFCIAKHLLALQEYAVETKSMTDDERLQGFLEDMSIEAREHHEAESKHLCGSTVTNLDELVQWARDKRKYLENLLYKQSCSVADRGAVQVPGHPEAGVQRGMFGEDVEVHPRGKGKTAQIDLFEHGRLAAMKDATGASCQLLRGSDQSIVPWFDRRDGEDVLFSIEAPSTERGSKLDDLIKKLKDGINSIWESDNYAAYLATLGKFHNYSLGNVVLIWMQAPHATRVAGFQTWKNLGRWVKKGEKGIAILAPCMPRKPKIEAPAAGDAEDADEEPVDVVQRPLYFKAVAVFDISQTEGKEIPTLEVPALSGDVSESYWQKLLNYAGNVGVPIDFTPRPGQSEDIKGQYDTGAKAIWIKPDEARAQQAKTLAHELAHFNSVRTPLFDRADEETIAESVAYVVCGHFGFDTGIRSFPYVAGWAGEEKRLRNNLSAVRSISDKMIGAMEILPRVAFAEGAAAELEALRDDLAGSSAAALIKYVRRKGMYKGEIIDLTPNQYREITGQPARSSIINEKGKIPWELALDSIATELGFDSDEALKNEVERLIKGRARIAELQHKIGVDAGKPFTCSLPFKTVEACTDPALIGQECKSIVTQCGDHEIQALNVRGHWQVHDKKMGDDPTDANKVIEVQYAKDARAEMADIAKYHMRHADAGDVHNRSVLPVCTPKDRDKREGCIISIKKRNIRAGCAPHGDGTKACPSPFAVCTARIGCKGG